MRLYEGNDMSDDELAWTQQVAEDYLEQIEDLQQNLRETLAALQESVRLQCHYAMLLNNHDGGQRDTTFDAFSWMARLRELKQGSIA
jgi:hypothetical protein